MMAFAWTKKGDARGAVSAERQGRSDAGDSAPTCCLHATADPSRKHRKANEPT
jgi:hypothetical protein